MDLTSLTDDALSTLILDAQREQQARHDRRKAELLESFRTQAEALGLDPAKLAAALSKRGGRARSSTGSAANATDGRSNVTPKWRNPDNPTETWAGRGAKPKWIKLGPDGKPLPKFALSASAA